MHASHRVRHLLDLLQNGAQLLEALRQLVPVRDGEHADVPPQQVCAHLSTHARVVVGAVQQVECARSVVLQPTVDSFIDCAHLEGL